MAAWIGERGIVEVECMCSCACEPCFSSWSGRRSRRLCPLETGAGSPILVGDKVQEAQAIRLNVCFQGCRTCVVYDVGLPHEHYILASCACGRGHNFDSGF